MPLGSLIDREINDFSVYHPEISVIKYIIMPDHVHILVDVKRRLEKPLGNAIGGLITGISNAWRKETNDVGADVFERGFNDRIIYSFRSLSTVIDYIAQNPYRLAVRQMRPEFFRRAKDITFG